MKKINKLSLSHLSKAEMEKRAMEAFKGGHEGPCGCVCTCGCLYEGPQCPSGDSYYGGESTSENDSANANDDATSAHNAEH